MKSITIGIAVAMCLLGVLSFAQQANAGNATTNINASNHAQVAFTKNMGQWPDSILFRASTGGTVMWFTKDGIYYQFTRHRRKPRATASWDPNGPGESQQPDSIESALIKAQFVNANPKAEVIGLEEQEYKCNYFLGDDPARWRANVPTYSGITIREMYPGADVTFRNDRGTVSYAVTGPREVVDQIKFKYDNITSGPTDVVTVPTKLGDKKFQGPLLISGNSTASAVNTPSTGNVTLSFSTYLGGGTLDEAASIALDDSGHAYVTGQTLSTNFPTQGPYQIDPADNNYDVFVTKMSPTGNSLVYSTYLGGTSDDRCEDIVLDDHGAAYLTGYTVSANFPLQNAYQPHLANKDVFITKLSADGGTLVYSTCLGGSNNEEAWGIAVDAQHNAYVTGHTASSNFPTLTPYMNDQTGEDAFLTKLSAEGNSLVYSTYFGGNAADYSWCIAVDASNCAYVAGQTTSTDFPTVAAYQPYQGAATFSDAFVTKFSATGTSLVYSTYLGGDKNDIINAIVLDDQGNAYITGSTLSTSFPKVNPYQSYQGASGFSDAFVTKLSPSGNSAVYSTYLGGTNNDAGYDIALDGSGNAYITGNVASINFPTRNAFQTDQGGQDAFITKLSPAGNSAIYSTYLGGGSNEWGTGIAVDAQGNAYVTGSSVSTNFPTFTAYQPDQGGNDVFVTKLAFTPCCTGTTGNINLQGSIDLSDLSWLITYLTTIPAPAVPCQNAANVNGAGVIDLSDLSLLISYLTVIPKPTLPACP